MKIFYFEACLPYLFQNVWDFDNDYLVAAGWGMTEFGGAMSSVLLKADLPVVSNSACSERLSNINDAKICTDSTDADTCQHGKNI